MKEGGIIGSDHLRLPQRPVDAEARKGLIELARERDVMALRWKR